MTTSSSHAIRIAFLHSIKSSPARQHPEEAIRECVYSLAKLGNSSEAISMSNRYEKSNLYTEVLKGVGESKCGQLPLKIFPLVQNQDIRHLMNIFAVKGIHPNHEFTSRFIDMVKNGIETNEDQQDLVPLAIASLRRVKTERKYLWNLYIGKSGPDCPSLTSHISEIAGTNGWGSDRVELILARRSGPISSETAAMLIKSLSRHEKIGSREFVNEIISATEDTDNRSHREPILSAIIDFHSLNRHFDDICEIISKNNYVKIKNFEKILRNFKEFPDNFFHFYNLMIDELGYTPTASIITDAIDVALNTKSAKQLVQVLQAAHVSGIQIEESQMKKLLLLTESFKVPVRVRRRIRELIRVIDPSFII